MCAAAGDLLAEPQRGQTSAWIVDRVSKVTKLNEPRERTPYDPVERVNSFHSVWALLLLCFHSLFFSPSLNMISLSLSLLLFLSLFHFLWTLKVL